MAIKLGTAILQLTTNSAKYDAGIKKASKSAWRFKKEQESVLDSLRKQWAGYGKAAMAGATAMAAAGAYTIKTQLA